MNNEIINEISENLNIKKEGIEAVLKLLEEVIRRRSYNTFYC